MTGRPGVVRLSVVIPTLGRLTALEGCLRALSASSFPRERFEVIVADDEGSGSVERTAAPWTRRMSLRVVTTGGRAGASAARNAGLAAARGNGVAFTDDDCEPEADWLVRLAEALDSNPGCAAGGTIVNGATGRCAEGSQAVLDATHAHFNGGAGGPTFFATSNLAFPAEALRAIGGFDESFPYAEDRELCVRWLAGGRRFVRAPDAVVRHMRRLTPADLWRQHFGYGRGAWRFHRVRSERDWGRFEIEPGFYRELARQVAHPRNGTGRPALAACAVTAQVANAAGFAAEALRSRVSTRRGPSR